MSESRSDRSMNPTLVFSAAADALSLEDRLALQAFADDHGRLWKSRLKALWLDGQDTGALRRLRNQLGPAGLDGIRLQAPAA